MGLRPCNVSHETFYLGNVSINHVRYSHTFCILANLFRETVNHLPRINNLYAIYFNFHCILSVYCYMLRFRYFNSGFSTILFFKH